MKPRTVSFNLHSIDPHVSLSTTFPAARTTIGVRTAVSFVHTIKMKGSYIRYGTLDTRSQQRSPNFKLKVIADFSPINSGTP